MSRRRSLRLTRRASPDLMQLWWSADFSPFDEYRFDWVTTFRHVFNFLERRLSNSLCSCLRNDKKCYWSEMENWKVNRPLSTDIPCSHFTGASVAPFHQLWPGCCLLEVLAGEVIFSKRSMVTTLHRGASLSSTPTPHFAGIVGLTVIRVKCDQT